MRKRKGPIAYNWSSWLLLYLIQILVCFFSFDKWFVMVVFWFFDFLIFGFSSDVYRDTSSNHIHRNSKKPLCRRLRKKYSVYLLRRSRDISRTYEKIKPSIQNFTIGIRKCRMLFYWLIAGHERFSQRRRSDSPSYRSALISHHRQTCECRQ